VTEPSPHGSRLLLFGLLACLLNLSLTVGLLSLGFLLRSIALRFGLVLSLATLLIRCTTATVSAEVVNGCGFRITGTISGAVIVTGRFGFALPGENSQELPSAQGSGLLTLGVIGWMIIGGLAGWVGSKIMGIDARMGLVLDIVVGILRATGRRVSAAGSRCERRRRGNAVFVSDVFARSGDPASDLQAGYPGAGVSLEPQSRRTLKDGDHSQKPGAARPG
jgi:hypothetical protein